MAITEVDTSVTTFIQITYSIPVSIENLIRREIHRVKDEDTVEFVIVSDTTVDVGNKDDYRDALQDNISFLETKKEDMIDTLDDQLELIQSQIDEIDSL